MASISKNLNLATVLDTEVYPIAVDYRKTIEQMIAEGEYDHVDGGITSYNFPVDVSLRQNNIQNIEMEMISYDNDMYGRDVLRDFELRGLRPATIYELLTFGLTYKYYKFFDKEYVPSVVALGSVGRRYRKGRRRDRHQEVPYIVCWISGRELCLSWKGDKWSRGCRFAAIRIS